MTLLLLGIAIGILITIGSVKMGLSSARYIWKHALGLLILAVLIVIALGHEAPSQPVKPKFDANLQPIE